MATVFRLHNNGAVNSGWFNSQPLTSNQINTIVSKGDEAATSIPSPFAQMALVKTAFDYLSQANVTIHYDSKKQTDKAMHQLVSDALDVAQLFFELQTFKQYFQIVSWNVANGFQRLSNDGNQSHKALAETLSVFWNSDGALFNFNQAQDIYFIMTKSNKLIGATSPVTMFMAAPDVRANLTGMPALNCANDVLFDDNYFSLDQRDTDFIVYMYTLQAQPNFANLFPSLNNYLLKIRNAAGLLPGPLANQIAQIQPGDINKYSPSLVQGIVGNQCNSSGLTIGERVFDAQSVMNASGFVIKPDYQIQGILPLVLPDNTFNNTWDYTARGTTWNPNWQVKQDASRTILPNSGLAYHWLSETDFLEEKIIKLPYKIDSSYYLTGTQGDDSYLLPLKPKFFEYFSPQSVNNLSIRTLVAGGIDVTLSVPVKNGTITFTKRYSHDDIIELNVHLAIMPFMKTQQIQLDYTVAIHDDRFNKQHSISLDCFANGNAVAITHKVERMSGGQNDVKTLFYRTSCFDVLRVSIDGEDLHGFIVPKMPEHNGNNPVSFAIDFGTTNTHIEYKVGNNAECGLDISSSNALWRSLMAAGTGDGRQDAIDKLFDSELFPRIVPYEVNARNRHEFPFRTAVAYNMTTNFAQQIESFLHVNPFLLFEKKSQNQNYQSQPNLKWSNYNQVQDKVLVEKYIESLLYLALYKTISMDCNPANAKITWFYPISMDTFEQNIFRNAWSNAFAKVFNTTDSANLIDIPESVAPYLFYRAANPGKNLSIDIGGGSSDIALFDNAANTPDFISSFRFAGNAIFGDGFDDEKYRRDLVNNGFYKAFLNDVTTCIQDDQNLKDILNVIEQTRSSANFSNFLFSLESNANLNFNYVAKLQQHITTQSTTLKMPFLLFFGAIVYYASKLMSLRTNVTKPDNIIFSGNASKCIRVLDGGQKLDVIADFFNFIINKTLGTQNGRIKVALDADPKKVTCKGAFRISDNVDFRQAQRLFWIGGKSEDWGKALNQGTSGKLPHYNETNEVVFSEVVKSIKEFYSILDSYKETHNIQDLFGIDDSSYQVFKDLRNDHLIDYIQQGIDSHHRKPEERIEETLFFMPFVAMLNDLGNKLT
jgi:hypothetical protein